MNLTSPHKKYKEIDKHGQFSMELYCWLIDNAPPTVEVDYVYLQQVLRRLVYLEKIAKNHIAESDIPRTIGYLLSVIPEKIKKKLE